MKHTKSLMGWHRLPVLILLLVFVLPVCAAQGEVGFFPLLLPSITQAEPGSDCCAIGSLTADAVRVFSGADFALVNAGDLSGDLPQGMVTADDIAGVFAIDRGLALAEVTVAELQNILEICLSHVALDMGNERIDRAASAYEGFPNLSGFTLQYDTSALPGTRVVALMLPDGSKLNKEDDSRSFTLAASQYLLEGGYGGGEMAFRSLDATLSDALSEFIFLYGNSLEKLDWARVTAIGAHNNNLVEGLPTPALVGSLAALAAVIAVISQKWKRKVEGGG